MEICVVLGKSPPLHTSILFWSFKMTLLGLGTQAPYARGALIYPRVLQTSQTLLIQGGHGSVLFSHDVLVTGELERHMVKKTILLLKPCLTF